MSAHPAFAYSFPDKDSGLRPCLRRLPTAPPRFHGHPAWQGGHVGIVAWDISASLRSGTANVRKNRMSRNYRPAVHAVRCWIRIFVPMAMRMRPPRTSIRLSKKWPKRLPMEIPT